jgi:hypothetical protein
MKAGNLPLAAAAAVLLLASGAVPRAAGQSYQTIKTTHFDVKYEKGVTEEDARKVADYLQEDFKYLSQKIGVDIRTPMEVRIYTNVGRFQSETKQKKAWRGGLYQRGVLHLQPVTALVQREIFERTISYELAMGLLDPVVRNGCPRWLRESFAVYHSGEMAGLRPPVGARLSSFADLDQDIQEYPDPPQRDDVHFVLGQTMKFFVDKGGEEKAFGLFRQFNGTHGVETVFKNTFGQEYAAVEKEWAAHIASLVGSIRK